jgi:hypothetical protein
VVIVIMINPASGAIYKYTSATVRAHMAYDALRESVMTMRLLRGGEQVVPVVNLSEREMKSKFGGLRPHFDIIAWKSLGGSNQTPLTPPTLPLTAPETPSDPGNAAPASTTSATPADDSQHAPYQAKPKPAINLATETLNAMDDVKPATMGEIVDDEIPW